jgi:hypothetical protein
METTETDISFAENLRGRGTWLETAKKIAAGMRQGLSNREIAQAQGLGKSGQTVSGFVAEIKRASKAKFKTLEQYYAAGRPCAYGKKVVAEQSDAS